MAPRITPNVNEDRLVAEYHLIGDGDGVARMAEDICVEQTVEFPVDLIEQEHIRTQIIGEVRSMEALSARRHRVCIAYPMETAGRELPQLLNVVFGNISLKPGIRLVSIRLPLSLARLYRGPRFGIEGVRARLGIQRRPLLATAIKPMGLSIDAFAELASQFARGGVDIIKDDHGLADQSFGRFEARVKAVCEAVRRVNDAGGRQCCYLPNITAPADEVLGRALFAKAFGAGGLLIAPGLVGLDTQRRIADDDRIALPIFSHPAFLGAYTVHSDAGISPGVLFGTLNRLAGADATIFPNFGGRFSFSPEACRDLSNRAAAPMAHIRPIFPVPAGGMRLDRVEEMRAFYGDDIVLLIGGDLRRHGRTVEASTRRFVSAVE